jgi:hypothetical protein
MRDIYPGIRFRNTDTIRGMQFNLASGRFALEKNSVGSFPRRIPESKSTVSRVPDLL